MKRITVATLVLAAALTAAAQAAPTGFYESFKLEPAAAFVAGKPVKVWCAKTGYDWSQFLSTHGLEGRDANGATAVGSSEIQLSPTACQNLRLRLAGQTVRNIAIGPSILLLAHEAIHARGISDEGQTDCAAVHELPRTAVKFFGVKPGKQLRALMAATWTYRATEPAAYRAVC